MIEDSLFECALSGRQPFQHEIDDDAEEGEPLLVGWLEVRVRRKTPNPRWQEIQEMKDFQARETYSQAVAAIKESGNTPSRADLAQVKKATVLQVDAFWAALEAQTPRYLVEEDIAYVAGPQHDAHAAGLDVARSELLEGLDLDLGDDLVVTASAAEEETASPQTEEVAVEEAPEEEAHETSPDPE